MSKEQFLLYIQHSIERPERISQSRWRGMLGWAIANGVSLPIPPDQSPYRASQSEEARKNQYRILSDDEADWRKNE